MSEPWPQTAGFSSNTLSNPYRLMNTSGINFRDHAGSMVSYISSPSTTPCPFRPHSLPTPLSRHHCVLDRHTDQRTIPPREQDLCHAALTFASDTLKAGGHFVCKFYQGAEDKAFQKKLQSMFEKVHREKPESSRSVRCPSLPFFMCSPACFGVFTPPPPPHSHSQAGMAVWAAFPTHLGLLVCLTVLPSVFRLFCS